VQEQTRITARDRLDIRTENHTQIDGALIASDSGNLRLDTGTLGFSDIAGKDKERSYYLNVGGSYGLGGGSTQQDASQAGKGTQGESGWSVEVYQYERDREQIVRATVGAGEIIVRSDAETGQDSTAGLNRDVSKAYEITKDKEERTDLYASKSSVEVVANPKEMLQKWQDDAENYGRHSVEAFTGLGVLKEQALSAAEHDKLVAALAWAPALLVDAMDAMDAMGTPTLGIFPGVANHGGLITQLPVLVTGDLQPMRVTGTFKADENGQLILKDGKPILDTASLEVQQFESFNDKEDKIFTNGIMNSMMDALANGLMQSGSGNGEVSFVLAYNPTHGLVGDLIESAFDKNLQGAVRSGTARNLNGLFQQGIDAGPDTTLHIYGHSQGGLLTWVAINGLDFSKGGSPTATLNTIQLSGAPVGAIQFHKDAEDAGFKFDDQRAFQVNRPDETVFFGLLPKTDTVSDLPLLLGGNAQYSNDPAARALGALFTVTSLFGEGSPHSNYACVTCKPSAPGSVDAQARDIVIKPTLIDSQGNDRRLE
jgi:filamentous hemagglutinin